MRRSFALATTTALVLITFALSPVALGEEPKEKLPEVPPLIVGAPAPQSFVVEGFARASADTRWGSASSGMATVNSAGTATTQPAPSIAPTTQATR